MNHDPCENHPERILFVDDDPKILSSFNRALGRNFELSTALSGEQGLAVLDAEPGFAVVVSDLMMPGMDGITFLAEVKKRHPQTVRVVLTGHGTLENAMDAMNSGHVFTFVTKPCPPPIMARVLKKALRQYEYHQAETELYALKRLKTAMEGVILGFAALVEARDPYTAGHQRSVASLCERIARTMGLDPGRIEGLRLAAMIHDIGKLYVPSEFLNKPGRLTAVEFEVIKSHPQVGADILRPVDFPWPVGDIVLQHHERLDGSGYPRGLGGMAIMMEARILAAADVVDAMAYHRPYRPALGLERALEELQEGKGTKYDPDVVEACLRLHEEGLLTPNHEPSPLGRDNNEAENC